MGNTLHSSGGVRVCHLDTAQMEGDLLPMSAPPAAAAAASAPKPVASSLFGKGRYKFWALAGIILLAFWSMLTGTVTLKWSAGDLNSLSDDLDVPVHAADLDVLEVEEREKIVRHMWEVYTSQSQGRRIRLPRFWQEAFEAAYEELASDADDVRDAAFLEITRMSMRMADLQSPPIDHYTQNVGVTHQRNALDRVGAKSAVQVQ